MRAIVRPIAVAATAGMFVVLIMGATVTSTGSGEGCGRSWPLCHGQLIPEFAVATAIEYSHRAVTAVEGLLIAALAASAWAAWRHRREIRVLVPVVIAFLLLQSGLGAWAVLYPQTPAALALHFGISLVALASVFLVLAVVFEADGADALRDRPAPPAFRWAVWGATAYTLVIVYLGAYLRHASIILACQDWPLCNGQLIPALDGPTGFVFAHRLAAVIGTLLLAGLVAWSARWRDTRPDLFWGSVAALALILAQSLSGAAVVWTRVGLFSALAHAGIMALLFAALSYLCLHVLPRPAAARQPAPAAAPQVGLGRSEPAQR
jgi:cytochrome c oxidase assembly protein subunit 15